MDEEKLHTRDFQLKGSDKNMRCKLLQKRSTGKTRECSKHLSQLPLKKTFYHNLRDVFFQIYLKYRKLVIPKILFILVLCSFNFYFIIMWPLQQYNPALHQNKIFWPHPLPSEDFSEIFKFPPTPTKIKQNWGVCMSWDPTLESDFERYCVKDSV